MPIYEFRCQKCGARFEELRSFVMDEKPGVKCPKCGSENVLRLTSGLAEKPKPDSCSDCGPRSSRSMG